MGFRRDDCEVNRITLYKTMGSILLAVGYMLGLPRIVTCQEAIELFQQPTIVDPGGIIFGVDKITNTFLFTGNADITVPIEGGLFRWTNQYSGSTFRTATTASRDNQNAQISLELPMSPSLSAIVRGSWILWADNSRSAGLSSLQRINGVGGVQYAPNASWAVEAFGGVESTEQLGTQATGPIVGAQANLYQLDVDQWSLSGRALTDWHYLDEQRTNSDVDLRTDVLRSIVGGSAIRVGAGYTSLARQYFTSVPGVVQALDVEGRFEDRFTVDADLTYQVDEHLSFGFLGLVQANDISRNYAEPVTGVPITSVDRQLTEFVLDLQGRIALSFDQIDITLGLERYQRDEANTVQAIHSIDDADLAGIRSQEAQRDNQTGRTRFFSQLSWRPSRQDTLTAEWTSWLLNYDTPSDQNDDDRDELQAIATIRYSRRISDVLSAGIALSGQYVHFVYLKASRSAFNNTNNVIRLSPFLRIDGGVVQMKPQFEVLANYTVYDFEGEGAAVSSYGFRQMSYRDSIRVQLTNNLRLESPVLVRYFERSTLLWGDFAEIPQTGNLEYLLRFLLFSQSSSAWDVGAGLRLYNLEQRALDPVPGLPSLVNGVSSWAPEVVLRFLATGGSSITLNGWYEFQTLHPVGTRELPNLLLLARVAL